MVKKNKKAEKPPFELCYNCQWKLENMQRNIKTSIRAKKNYFDNFLKKKVDFKIGNHGREKAALMNIDMNKPEEREYVFKGEVIDIQSAKYLGEFKFIICSIRNDLPIHYIFLDSPNSQVPTLINVYNPLEGMNFKWSIDGKTRIYLNQFRTCCPHPLDHIDNYNKPHHGINHKLYNYQK